MAERSYTPEIQTTKNSNINFSSQPRPCDIKIIVSDAKEFGNINSVTTNGSGEVNLAYIKENDDEETSCESCEFGDCSCLSDVPEPGRKYSMRQQCVFENQRRRSLSQIRIILSNSSVDDQIRLDLFLKIFKTKEVLKKLFEVFDYHNEGKLNQDKWVELLKSRLSGCNNDGGSSPAQLEDKQVDFVEVVESVAYAVCGEADVEFQQFCDIFRTKNVLNKLFRLIDHDLDGVVTAEQVMEFISQLGTARSGSRLTKDNIQWLEKLFRQYVGDDKEIKKEDFSKIIQTKNQFFTDRVFDIFDGDSSGSISLQEFLVAINKFAGEDNPEDKIKFLFDVYDVDGDGLIQEAELEQVMRACMEENGMKFSDEQIHELTTALFEDADVEGRGALTYEALKAQLEKHTGLLENLSISIERWLVPPKPVKKVQFSLIGKMRSMKPHQLSVRYIKNNYVYLIWLLAFLVTNITLFISKAVSFSMHYPNATVYLAIARAAGQCLNFNCTFIVVVMLRLSLTYLRARRVSNYIPIDQHINFHKMTGRFIFIFGVIHSVMHLFNIEPGVINNPHMNAGNFTYMEVLFDPKATQTLGLVPGCAFNTGVVLAVILSVMVLCSLPFVRRGGCFEVFYWTHLLYAPFWILLIIHAPNFWKWFVVPGIIFIFEQALRYYHWRVGRGRTHISSGMLLPSKVTHLIIARPPNFEFNPGDYVFVRIPQIAKYEWHPFTISSGPEEEDAIWLHVRAVGQWTNRLFDYFEQEQSNIENDANVIRPRMDIFNRLASVKRIRTPAERPLALVGNHNQDIPVIPDPNKRAHLKSVADSANSVIPESEHSTDPSCTDIPSSADEMSDQVSIMPVSKIVFPPRKTRLTSTKSMPDVFERVTQRERKLFMKEYERSLSVRSGEKIAGDSRSRSASNVFPKSGRDRSAARSMRYMRNKPQIIELKAPDSEDESAMREKLLERQSISSNDRLAEEGRSRVGSIKVPPGKNKDIPEEGEPSFYELGTTLVSGDVSPGRSLEIYVDGPYGAPSSHIFRAQHAVLIATGIGVTPFASILQSIMRRYWASRNMCPNCNYTWCSELPLSVLNLRKVDFFWINRDQRCFEWFVHLLSRLEIEQAELGGAMERFLDMHMYITSALQRTDMKAVGLQLALDLLHEKEKRDLITGLKTRTNAGRPNWNKIFKQLDDQHKGKVTVFYCGPPALARTLKIKCDEFNFSFRKELF